MFTLGGFAIVQAADGGVLFCLRKDRPIWNLPGGRVELHESPWKATERELFEETGVVGIVDRLIAVDYDVGKNDLASYFLCKAPQVLPTETDEAERFSFFTKADMPETMYSRHRRIVERFFDGEAAFFSSVVT